MSGGEQQMLALARAYIQQPGVRPARRGLAWASRPRSSTRSSSSSRRLAREGAALLLVEQYVTGRWPSPTTSTCSTGARCSFAGEPSELDADALAEHYVGAGH